MLTAFAGMLEPGDSDISPDTLLCFFEPSTFDIGDGMVIAEPPPEP